MSGVDDQIDRDQVARRAYELAQTSDGARSDEDNWLQAERELRAENATDQPPRSSRRRKADPTVETVPETD